MLREDPGHRARAESGRTPAGGLGTPARTPVPAGGGRDSEYHHFRYRIPPARVRLLEVGGDLQLDSVKIF